MIKRFFRRAIAGLALATWMLSILILVSGILTILWALFFGGITIRWEDFVVYMLISGFACTAGILCFDKILDWGCEE